MEQNSYYVLLQNRQTGERDFIISSSLESALRLESKYCDNYIVTITLEIN